MSMAAIASERAIDMDRGPLALDPSHRALRMPMAASFLLHAGLFAGALFWWQADGASAPRGEPDATARAINVTVIQLSEPAAKPAQAAPAPQPVETAPPPEPEPAPPRKVAADAVPVPIPEPKPETAPAKPAPETQQIAARAPTARDGASEGATRGFRNTSGRARDDVLLVEPRFRVPPRPPVYPRRARDLEQQGEALIRARLDRRGNPEEVLVWKSSGFVLLDHAAMSAVRGWQFEPAKRNGEPIVAWVQIPVRFALN